ncbi:cathepsin L2 [Pelomyxa schiedti]|nr:cathepsin L2 [Pelomyxa schiedti]
MKTVVAFLLFAAVASAVYTKSDFSIWAKKYNKAYASREEEDMRFKIWINNRKYYDKFNTEGHSWTLGPNQFTDFTADEFEAKYLMQSREFVNGTATMPSAVSDVDWTSSCAAVKDQGSCGSCWAFSTTGSIEPCRKITGDGQLISLSEQYLVDCCTGACCNGCSGGTIAGAMKCAESGLPSESSYPYTGIKKTCQKATLVTKITSYTAVTSGDVNQLQSLLMTQPVSVTIDARLLSGYTGGIWCPSTCSTSTLDHAVVLVGLNTESKYYKIRNSWGASWGESGYFRMCWGTNQCGIATAASQPKGCVAA